MKDSVDYAANLKKLCNRLRRELGTPAKPDPLDPVSEILLACLTAYTTESQAKTALHHLQKAFVDFNELRVCRIDEIAEVFGARFPHAKDIAGQIITLLKQIFDRQDHLHLFQSGGKREAKAFLESLEGSTPYLISRVMLYCLNAHCFPVNTSLLEMLRNENAIDPAAEPAVVQTFLERQIPASKIQKTYVLLRQYADHYQPGTAAADKNPSAPKTPRKKTAPKNKTGKKKPAKPQ